MQVAHWDPYCPGVYGQAGPWSESHWLQETLDQAWGLCTTSVMIPIFHSARRGPSAPTVLLLGSQCAVGSSKRPGRGWALFFAGRHGTAKPWLEELSRLLQDNISLPKGYHCKSLDICTSNTSSPMEYRSHSVTACTLWWLTCSNCLLICLNIFRFLHSQPLWLLSLAYIYADPFPKRQAWGCCELGRLAVMRRWPWPCGRVGQPLPCPKQAVVPGTGGQGARRRHLTGITWDVSSMLGHQGKKNPNVVGGSIAWTNLLKIRKPLSSSLSYYRTTERLHRSNSSWN